MWKCLFNGLLGKQQITQQYTSALAELGSTREFSPDTLRQPLRVMNKFSPLPLEGI